MAKRLVNLRSEVFFKLPCTFLILVLLGEFHLYSSNETLDDLDTRILFFDIFL